MHSRHRAALAGAAIIAAATLLLLLPALLNGFPLIFPDTGAYLSVAWSKSWTLDRPGFYGLAFRAFSWLPALWQLWTVVVLQCAVISAVLLMMIRTMAPRLSAAHQLAIMAIVALTSSLPWHSSQLMPDALTGICVLLAWLAISRDPTAPGTPSLWLATVVTGIMHLTHLFLVVATCLAALLCQRWGGAALRQLSGRGAAALAAVAAILLSQIAANGLLLHRWAVDPVSSTFLFARLNEDGLIEPWMRRHCREVAELCAIYPELPKNSQRLLWGTDSPFAPLIWDRLNARDEGPMLTELGRASIGSIRERPLQYVVSGAKASADQFVHFAALDDLCPATCASASSAVYRVSKVLHPELLPPLRSSAQFQGDFHKELLRALTTPVAAVAMILLVGLGVSADRRRDVAALSLVATVLSALLTNAIVAGTLSNVRDRYQSRIVWLAPFAALVIIFRWWTASSSGDGRLAGGHMFGRRRSATTRRQPQARPPYEPRPGSTD